MTTPLTPEPPPEAPPALAWSHVVAALDAVGDPDNVSATLGPGVREETLFVCLPSAGAAMVFAAALAGEIAASETEEDPPGTGEIRAGAVLEIMARASNTYDVSLAEHKEPGTLIVYFPGVRVTGYPEPGPAVPVGLDRLARVQLEDKAVGLLRDLARDEFDGLRLVDAGFPARLISLLREAWTGGRWQAAEELADAWTLYLFHDDPVVMRDALTGILPPGWSWPAGKERP